MPLARSAANNAALPVAGVVFVFMLPFCPWVPDGRRGLCFGYDRPQAFAFMSSINAEPQQASSALQSVLGLAFNSACTQLS
ncbi:MAG: hypothetical protein WCR06_03305, partial [bacterium]